MVEGTQLQIDLHFARARQSGDAYAFQFEPQEYTLTDAGGVVTHAELLWDQGLLADIAALCKSGNDGGIQQRLGERLRKFLSALGWQVQAAAIAEAVFTGRPVIITIRSAAAELYALPWELTTLKNTGQHLGGLPKVVIRYEWPGSKTAPRAGKPGDGRIIVAWSAATGGVPASEHIQAIDSACVEGHLRFNTDTDVLNHVSLPRLVDALDAAEEQGAPITVLHLLCHGSSVGSSFGLALDDSGAGGRRVIVDGRRLEQVLQPFANQLRVIVLAACDGGNPGSLGNELGSVAQCLHRSGFLAVVASRYPLSTHGSVAFTQAFYQSLVGKGASVEAALLRARRRLITDASSHDWASVQLYARSGDAEAHRLLGPRVASATQMANASMFPIPSASAPGPESSSSTRPAPAQPSSLRQGSKDQSSHHLGLHRDGAEPRPQFNALLCLDRTAQYGHLIWGSPKSRKQNRILLLHGSPEQNIEWFVKRVEEFLRDDRVGGCQTVNVPLRLNNVYAGTAEDWGLHLKYAMETHLGESSLPLAELIEQATERAPLVLSLVAEDNPLSVLGMLSGRQRAGLKSFVTTLLPKLFTDSRRTGVTVLVPLEVRQSDDTSDLLTEVQSWLAEAWHTAERTHDVLPEVRFPSWDDVASYLRTYHPPLNNLPEVIKEAERQYAKFGQASTFEQLAKALNNIVARHS